MESSTTVYVIEIEGALSVSRQVSSSSYKGDNLNGRFDGREVAGQRPIALIPHLARERSATSGTQPIATQSHLLGDIETQNVRWWCRRLPHHSHFMTQATE